MSRSTDTLSPRAAAVTPADVRDWMHEHGADLWRRWLRKAPADVQSIWHLATLRRDALVQNGDRSVVEKRFVDGRPRFYKAYKDGFQNLQLIEKRALEALDQEGIRDTCRPHFAHLISTHAAKTRLSHGQASTEIVRQANPAVETEDAGPDLLRWQALYPTSAVGQDALPVPLFALPLFLAAVARQAITGLEVFHRNGVVHMDPWLANLCWQPDAAWLAKPSRPLTLDLLRLPLKWIDFELALTRGYTDMTPVPCSAWHAPQVHALAALQQQHEAGGQADPLLYQQALAAQQALDGRVDLWTWGYVLAQAAQGALQWVKVMRQDSRQQFGADSPAAQAVLRATDDLPQGLHTLIQWAQSLQQLPQPLTPPDYRRLHEQLEAAFPALRGGAPGAAQLHVTLQPPGQRRWPRLQRPRVQPPRWLAPALGGAALLAGLAWQHQALAAAVDAHLLQPASRQAGRWVVLGLPGLDEAARQRLANWWRPDPDTVRELLAQGQFATADLRAEPSPDTAAQWQRDRERVLRALAAYTQDPLPPEQMRDAEHLLTQLFDLGNVLEQARGDQPARRVPPANGAQQPALDRLQPLHPLATWLLARYLACYAQPAGSQDDAVLQLARQLSQWPARQDADGWYRNEGQRWLQRQRDTQALCPIADTATP